MSWLSTKKRLLIIISLGIVVIALAYAYRYFRLSLPYGTGPAGPSISQKYFQNVWDTRSVVLLALGDSITASFGVKKRYGYVERLMTNPVDEFPDMRGICLSKVFPKIKLVKKAVSNSTSLEHIKVIKELKPYNSSIFGIVVITSGGNDIINDYGRHAPKEGAMYGATFAQAGPWIKNFAKRLDMIVTHLQKIFPGGCKIFLANIYDPTDGIGDTHSVGLPAWPDVLPILKAYNKTIEKCCQKYSYVHMVDIHQLFLGHGIHCREFWKKNYKSNDPNFWFGNNIEDPSKRGYDAIRRLFLQEMISAFDK